jgi:hypothetical protein
MGISDLQSLQDVQQQRRAPQKGLPPVLEKKERQRSKESLGEAFRLAVWKRDKGKSRATGRKLVKSGTTNWDQLGEVDHVINRSTAPERIYDVTNGILLSKTENRLKKVVCRNAPEFHLFEVSGPDDRALPQAFTWRDVDGTVTKTRMG